MASEAPLVRLDIESREESAGGVRAVIRPALEACALDDATVRAVLTALTEIVINGVDAQRRDGVSDPLTIEVVRGAGSVAVAVRDHARGFSELGHPSRNLRIDQDKPGLGLGLTIARGLVDRLLISEAGGSTTVSLVVEFDGRTPPDPDHRS